MYGFPLSRTFTTEDSSAIAFVNLDCCAAGGDEASTFKNLWQKFTDKKWWHFGVVRFHPSRKNATAECKEYLQICTGQAPLSHGSFSKSCRIMIIGKRRATALAPGRADLFFTSDNLGGDYVADAANRAEKKRKAVSELQERATSTPETNRTTKSYFDLQG